MTTPADVAGVLPSSASTLRRSLAVALTLGAGLAATPAVAAAVADGPDRIVVGFARAADADERRATRAAVDGRLLDAILPRVQVLAVPDGTADAALADLDADADVAWVEEDVRQTAQAAPDDPSFTDQWALRNTGQTGGVPGADIDLLPAWDLSRGDGVLVGVVDSGVSVTHADTGTLATNTAEVAANRLDDDANGLVDDVSGWDFANKDNDPADDNGHGTSVGSVVNAATGNAVGMAGVAPGARVMHVKALGADGSGFSSDVAAGMDYLADQGARIVNLSLGGPQSKAQAAVIAAHPETLFVASAGNSGADNDDPAVASYPCAEPAANVLCVGASTASDGKATFSSYGLTSVDVMAPGRGIHGASWSTGGITTWSGTSFSSPITAGVAALLKAYRPAATAVELKTAILGSVDPVSAFVPITVTGGRVNAVRAFQLLAGTPAATSPSAPSSEAPSTATAPATEPVAAEPVATAPVTTTPAPDPAPPIAAPLPAAAVPAPPAVRIAPGLQLAGRRHALVRVRFGAVERRRRTKLRLVARSRVLGAGSVRPVAHRMKTVRVALTRRGRTVLRSRRAVPVTVEVRLGDRAVRTPLRFVTAFRRR